LRVLRGLVADVIPFSWVDGPGNRTTVFLQGCNFDCRACHNPHTIASESIHARSLSVAELVAEIRPNALFLSGVTVSGGEATQQPEFLYELFRTLKADPELAHLTCFIDSNGGADTGVWEELAAMTDGVMLDLKVFDPDLHLELTGQRIDAVLESIRTLSAMGLLYEVRLLLVPGINDDPALLRRTAQWLATISADLRIVLNPFRTHGVRSPADTWAEPTSTDLWGYADILRSGGLDNVHVVKPLA
jgi:pyruvate formate lyase activating enzyme